MPDERHFFCHCIDAVDPNIRTADRNHNPWQSGARANIKHTQSCGHAVYRAFAHGTSTFRPLRQPKTQRRDHGQALIGLERVQQLLEDPLAVNTLRFDYGIDDRWFHNKMTVMEHLSREPTTSPAVHSVEGRGLMGRLRRMCHTLRLRGCFSGCVRTEKIAAMGNRRI